MKLLSSDFGVFFGDFQQFVVAKVHDCWVAPEMTRHWSRQISDLEDWDKAAGQIHQMTKFNRHD